MAKWKLVRSNPFKVGRLYALKNFVILQKPLYFQEWVYSDKKIKLTMSTLEDKDGW